MSEDPKGFDAGDYNLFRYCGNDPVDRTDPMGLGWGPSTLADIPPPPPPSLFQRIMRSLANLFQSQQNWEKGAIEGGSTRINKWERGGNWGVPRQTDDKLTLQGKPAAGLTKQEFSTRAESDGSITPVLNLDPKVRKNLASQDPQLPVVEQEHAKRWDAFVKRMEDKNSQASKWFGNHYYESTERARAAAQQFFEPRVRNEFIQQYLDLDAHGRPHEVFARKYNLTE